MNDIPQIARKLTAHERVDRHIKMIRARFGPRDPNRKHLEKFVRNYLLSNPIED